ncbi:cytochrome P450 [Rhizobium sp. SSA_523]|uniref:cytochrome P450 n=1 Tax=Rhizobium sp. SSA_523 TaxID=2952477 RepID=UPI002091A522|nr:cytochrome P450 [Rhizobium sp. SSA_523]MCO5732920.1 cytochrome P450 [Rhizobium sp. SSA_523]WKC23465.1 cytochrome P450 [Rhizobium sp. SSA_523]
MVSNAMKAWSAADSRSHGPSAVMEEARSQIEQRFLDGGAVLLSVLDILNKMIASVDDLTGSLDETTARTTLEELGATASALQALMKAEASRQTRFREIATAQGLVRPHVASMQETLRYLRTFAVTAKITGAGIADFSGFAEEILQRIQEGSDQVSRFSTQLTELGSGIGPVIVKGEETISRYSQSVPHIVRGLTTGMDQLSLQRETLCQRADQVKAIAMGVQTKLAAVLSSMQVGDITRQRIEHCQASFDLLDDYLQSGDAAALTGEQRQRLTHIISNLVSAQLDQSRADFDRDTRKIVQTIASFRSDLQDITAVQSSMLCLDGDENDHPMRRLEAGVSDARHAVVDIEKVAGEADSMTKQTISAVKTLLQSISLVQLVRSDIHYMALNTNLRCGKIGEEGKAINVVTAELRSFAGQLDEVAEKTLLELKGLETAAQMLIGDPGEDVEVAGLDARLDAALERIRTVCQRMDSDLLRMSGDGQRGVEQMDIALSRLNFQAELGDLLSRCADEIRLMPNQSCSTEGLEAAIEVLGGRINRLYTMASERELHAAVLGTAAPDEAPLTVLSDDDLDAALF